MVRHLYYWGEILISSRLALELALSRPASQPCLLPNLQSLNWAHNSNCSSIVPLLLPPNLTTLRIHSFSFETNALWYHLSIRRVLPLCGRLRSLTLDFPHGVHHLSGVS
jgi:hypothetical protein